MTHCKLVALLSAALIVGCGGASTSGGTANTAGTGSTDSTGGSSEPAVSKGPQAPDFTLPSLDGKNVSLSEYLGKGVVVINFWSTTCDPCMVELPHMVELYEKEKARGLTVLAISLDGPETRSQVSSVVHDKKMSFPVLLDEETSVVARYNPKKDMPFTVIIDKNGSIVKKFSGYSPGDEAKVKAEVEKLLQ